MSNSAREDMFRFNRGHVAMQKVEDSPADVKNLLHFSYIVDTENVKKYREKQNQWEGMNSFLLRWCGYAESGGQPGRCENPAALMLHCRY
jgi:hypothetical protein